MLSLERMKKMDNNYTLTVRMDEKTRDEIISTLDNLSDLHFLEN